MVDFNDLSVLTRFWLQDAAPPIYITWLGHASVRIAQKDLVIYVDPLDMTTSPKDATLILVSHSHGDHYSPADISRVAGPTTQFIAPVGVATELRSRPVHRSRGRPSNCRMSGSSGSPRTTSTRRIIPRPATGSASSSSWAPSAFTSRATRT